MARSAWSAENRCAAADLERREKIPMELKGSLGDAVFHIRYEAAPPTTSAQRARP